MKFLLVVVVVFCTADASWIKEEINDELIQKVLDEYRPHDEQQTLTHDSAKMLVWNVTNVLSAMIICSLDCALMMVIPHENVCVNGDGLVPMHKRLK